MCRDNFAIIISDDHQAQHCRDLEISFFFAYPARTFYQLKRMRELGATDAYITDEMTHSLFDIEDYFSDITIRVVGNSAGWGTIKDIWPNICGAWFHPEVLYQLDMIDVCEFRTSLEHDMDIRKQEQALYRIYAERHEWSGKLEEIIPDIDAPGDIIIQYLEQVHNRVKEPANWKNGLEHLDAEGMDYFMTHLIEQVERI